MIKYVGVDRLAGTVAGALEMGERWGGPGLASTYIDISSRKETRHELRGNTSHRQRSTGNAGLLPKDSTDNGCAKHSKGVGDEV